MTMPEKNLEIEVGNWKTIFIQEGQNPLTILSNENNHLKVLSDNILYDVYVKKSDPDHKNFIINVEGFDFPVKINEPIDKLIKKMGFLKPVVHAVKEIKAPMPGLVLDIFVKPGDFVEENQNILSLEAMKMENILKAHGSGTIKEISVSKGAAVDKNQTLIVFE
jgi:biotin carboxyl carrier protein